MRRFSSINGVDWLPGRWALLLIACLGFWGEADARNPAPQCVVCETELHSGQVWKHRRGLVCSPCAQIKIRCSLCGLPALQFIKTGDGRVICRYESNEVLMLEPEAQALFREVQEEVIWMTDGKMRLKSSPVQVRLYDVDYWNHDSEGAAGKKMRRSGYSQSRRGSGSVDHYVLLLSGLLKSEMTGVCAHELTHLWINENLAPERKLQFETTEGICELVAYKLMVRKKEAEQIEKIRANPYTNGKITEFIRFESEFGLNNILDWVVKGQGAVLDERVLRRFTSDTHTYASLSLRPPPQTKPKPTELVLKGILPSKTRPMALINDKTLEVGERGTIRLKDRSVRLECLAIHAKGVEVLLVETGERLQLVLNEE